MGTIVEALATEGATCHIDFVSLASALEGEFQQFETNHEPDECTSQIGIEPIVTADIIHLGFQFVDVATQSMEGLHLQRLLHLWMNLLLKQQFVEIHILMRQAQCITLTAHQHSTCQRQQGQQDSHQDDTLHTLPTLLLRPTALWRTNGIDRARHTAERTVDAPLVRDLQLLPRQRTEHAQQSSVRTEELAERTSDEDGHDQQHDAESHHTKVTSQSEDANERIQSADEELASCGGIENGERQIDPRNHGQRGRDRT